MLSNIRLQTVLRLVVIGTVAISLIIFYVVQTIFLPGFETFRVALIALPVSTILILAALSPAFFRASLTLVRRLGGSHCHDLNGAWLGKIFPSSSPPIIVRAIIRQSLAVTEIDMHGETMKSITLTASSSVEAGQFKVYYVYRAEPRNPDWPPYTGTTKLDLRKIAREGAGILALSGQYYTDRNMAGRIELKQIGSDPTEDVSYY